MIDPQRVKAMCGRNSWPSMRQSKGSGDVARNPFRITSEFRDGTDFGVVQAVVAVGAELGGRPQAQRVADQTRWAVDRARHALVGADEAYRADYTASLALAGLEEARRAQREVARVNRTVSAVGSQRATRTRAKETLVARLAELEDDPALRVVEAVDGHL